MSIDFKRSWVIMPYRQLLYILFLIFVFACKNSNKPREKDIVETTQQLEERTAENLKKLLDYAAQNKDKINDSVKLTSLSLLQAAYSNNNFKTIWSHEDTWQPLADSLYEMISRAKEYGLFPSDYHFSSLTSIRSRLEVDSLARRDAALWTRGDVLFTEAYFAIARHLKLGRLPKDSITLRKDSLFNDNYFIENFNGAITNKNIIGSLQVLEPKYPGYIDVKNGIRPFLQNAVFKKYTYLNYPYKDTLAFVKTLQQRLSEDGFAAISPEADSTSLAVSIANYQLSLDLKPTGKISESIVRGLNNTDWEQFKSIAVTLDQYKLMADFVPETFVMVNLPAYSLYVYNADTLVFQSRVIIGSPKTKTPLLNSRISNFITYPQWTVPYSIIFREMLPKIQKNVDYLEQQNLMVVDRDENVVDPYSIDWSQLNKKSFPYLLRQKEGDDNSLGIIKFNFVNKYSVYLHDTNARWLFSKASRALSHGCVRVQKWEDLSRYLTSSDTIRFPPDSLKAWIGRQEKHTVTGFPRMPLFIRYFIVEGKKGKLLFYNDIYGYNRLIKEKYFTRKTIS
ncbi:MAG: L,D-transpeptidase family protein [Chitinophagaceae bacterium]